MRSWLEMTRHIQAIVTGAREAGLEINDRNIVDLVLDNTDDLDSCEDAVLAIRRAGYPVRTR